MSNKTTRIIYIVLMILASLSLIMSGVMKLMGGQQIIEGLTKVGLGKYVALLGAIELISVALFLYPKTYKIGFALLCSYLGGAISIELAGGQAPIAAIFLTLIWISVFLRNKLMFLPTANSENK